MQIIEKNSLNVRSAVYRLRKIGDELEFILFPMIHIGSRSFYDEVRQRLSKCDLILMEGVQSKKASFLTLSYRVVRKINRMQLVTQQEALRISELSDKIVTSDMHGETFNEHWGALPMSLRAQMLFFVPLYVLYLFFCGTKNVVAENISVDDLPSREEVLNYDEEFGRLDSLLLDKRDQVVISRIESLYQANRTDKKTVGVVYGAMHMRNIMRFLSEKLGYRIIGSEWITVFDL
jgi:hypothetical protein